MQKNDLIKLDDTIFRVLQIESDRLLVIDCIKRTMPIWKKNTEYIEIFNGSLGEITGIYPKEIEELDAESRRIAYAHYNQIAGILPFLDDDQERSAAISKISEQFGISKQTIRANLCLYLAYQSISVLAPKKEIKEKPLSQDEKNIRWALNQFFYTKHKNSLQTAYTMMLKEKYCDTHGQLVPQFPTFHQFRYFYRKTKKMQTYYISRDGIKDYQRNHRPLLGDGIQSFAPNVGTGMLDATICDIYLVDDAGNLVGRPVLTACVDAYSGLCCGYVLSWEGGVYSLRALMSNVVADKVRLCRDFGITIQEEQWPCCGCLPGIMVTDMGSEYKSDTFSQIAELGVTLINLPAYRPELKGAVEKFFDVLQGLYKPYLKGKGTIEPDFQERGAHDYRKDACLTMREFETVILRCIVYYNSRRIVTDFPYSDAMITDKIKPYASDIWNYNWNQAGATLIPVTQSQLILTLLPRAAGKFSRKGLIVNGLRYHREDYTEQYLCGGNVICAYNPENTSSVWLIKKSEYIEFYAISECFSDMSFESAFSIRNQKKKIVAEAEKDNLQAKIDLANHLQAISQNAPQKISQKQNLGNIRETKKREKASRHIDFMKEAQK